MRYLGIERDRAIEFAERIDIKGSGTIQHEADTSGATQLLPTSVSRMFENV